MRYKKLSISQLPTPYEVGVTVLEGKWRSRLLTALNYYTAMRYVELRECLKPISDTVLASTLRDLLSRDMVSKVELDDASVCYILTEKGKGLIPVLKMLGQWCEHWGYAETEDVQPEEEKRVANPFRTSSAGMRRANKMFASIGDDLN